MLTLCEEPVSTHPRQVEQTLVRVQPSYTQCYTQCDTQCDTKCNTKSTPSETLEEPDVERVSYKTSESSETH